MNPRYRRLIIPGLLVILMVIVVVAAIAREAAANPADPELAPVPEFTEVSVLADERIVESSGLAVSRRFEDVAYTVNDSGNEPLIFAVSVASGKTLGVTELRGEFIDIEALSLDSEGRLWIADTGDNQGQRPESALYAIDEPGTESGTVTPERYPLRYSDWPPDIEALAIHPDTGVKYLIDKGFLTGEVYEVPSDQAPGEVAVLEPVAHGLPPLVTDAAFSPDGSAIAVRTYVTVHDVDPETWKVRSSTRLPDQKQGETIAFEGDGSTYLIGSEGAQSSLLRLSWDGHVASDGPAETAVTASEPPDADQRPIPTAFIWAIAVVAAVSVLVAAAVARRRRH